jgi:hypothetical protein
MDNSNPAAQPLHHLYEIVDGVSTCLLDPRHLHLYEGTL